MKSLAPFFKALNNNCYMLLNLEKIGWLISRLPTQLENSLLGSL